MPYAPRHPKYMPEAQDCMAPAKVADVDDTGAHPSSAPVASSRSRTIWKPDAWRNSMPPLASTACAIRLLLSRSRLQQPSSAQHCA